MRPPHTPQYANRCSRAGPSRGAPPSLRLGGRRTLMQTLQVLLILLPRQVSGMRVALQLKPLLAQQPLDAPPAAVWLLAVTVLPIRVRAGITGIVQNRVH